MDEQEKRLWQVYSSSRSTDDRNRLVELYFWLAEKLARKYFLKVRGAPSVEYDALLSAACEGLIEAVERYDVNRNILFSTYAPRRILGQIADWLRETDAHTRLYRLREPMVREWAKTLDHQPTVDEVYEHFGFKLERRNLISLSKSTNKQSEGDHWRVSEIHDSVGVCDRSTSIGEVSYLLAGLGRRDRLAVVLYCIEGFTMKETAAVIGVSESRLSQMMKELLPRMRENFERAA